MNLSSLANELEGELHYDKMMRAIYATDASVYRELPIAVAIPKNCSDLKLLIKFASSNNTSLIPRSGGTSLAGQCVGAGIVVDISKHFNKILEFNQKEAWVRVQPGVIRDELNHFLKPFGYFFSPITSTANRAMIGGMVGNNASGTTSIQYGTTRDHLYEMEVLLADGNVAKFTSLTVEEFSKKCQLKNLEGSIYQQIYSSLNNPRIQKNIRREFPKQSIHRRNTGYALDTLLDTEVFGNKNEAFNFSKLLCGSEGTLAFTTSVKLHVDKLPDPFKTVIAVHFENVNESLLATQIAMTCKPSACELMDKIILDCTKENAEQAKNRFFVEGDPATILMVEFNGNSQAKADGKAEQLKELLKHEKLGFSYPMIKGDDVKKVWQLRSAGLGLLANIPGDKKAVACIEDTAVSLEDLPAYIEEFAKIMEGFKQESVYYAHAGAGELHLRPILNLKQSKDVKLFREISKASAKLVKKYNGSLSGEHGDGRVRAEFIPMMVGEENYQLFKALKHTWDPKNIFNPGKIVDAAPMNTSLRYESDVPTKELYTLFDFSSTGGMIRTAEKCNGSGDCRKLPLSGGTMCPSYQATRNEKDTTRARANILREFLTKSEKKNPFDHDEIKEVLDLCISCKGCSSECPSNVDMTTLKAEFTYQYQKENGVPLRSKLFANINQFNSWGGVAPRIYNLFLTNSFLSGLAKNMVGVAKERSLPKIQKTNLRKWFGKHFNAETSKSTAKKTVYIFCDEFTNWNDTVIGKKAIELLDRLGYFVQMVEHPESGRAALSKGLLPLAKKYANSNVSIFSKLISLESPLLGIEPSCLLSFRDEYPKLVDDAQKKQAIDLSKNCLLIDEFIAQEIKLGNITFNVFTSKKENILLHGHCHQKALSDLQDSVWLLSLPKNYHVEVIPSGCCGMAGSFGYEKEHFETSQKIGSLVLFPAVNKAMSNTIIAATGTSCRHQIADGTGRIAKHPIEILYDALL